MASTSRALLVAGALLASASLAQAGDRGAFAATSQDARADLSPIVKPAPADVPAPAVAAQAAATEKVSPKPSRHKTRLARRAAKAVAVAALKATFAPPSGGAASAALKPAAPQAAASDATALVADASGKAAGASRSNTEAAAPTPSTAPLLDGPREKASGTVSELLARHALANGVPLKLAQAVVTIESRGNARASHAGALGLMQIKYGTARAAGFSGPAVGLFAADTNLRFGMKILGDAYRAAGGDTCGALMRYQSGHYATHMNNANRAYCAKARSLMAGV